MNTSGICPFLLTCLAAAKLKPANSAALVKLDSAEKHIYSASSEISHF